MKAGFEPAIRDYRIHPFQGCAIVHSATSPYDRTTYHIRSASRVDSLNVGTQSVPTAAERLKLVHVEFSIYKWPRFRLAVSSRALVKSVRLYDRPERPDTTVPVCLEFWRCFLMSSILAHRNTCVYCLFELFRSLYIKTSGCCPPCQVYGATRPFAL